MKMLNIGSDSLIKKCNELVAKIHYAQIINTRPLAVMFLTGFLSTSLTGLALKFTDWPSFSDPKLGFETRGTMLSGRMLTYRNLGKELSVFPDSSKRFFTKGELYHKFKRNVQHHASNATSETNVNACNSYQKQHLEVDQFVQLVFEASSDNILFEMETIIELCKFQNRILEHGKRLVDNKNSEIWSLPSFLTCMSGSNSCTNISKSELEIIRNSIDNCSRYRNTIIKCYNKLRSHVWMKSSNLECNSVPTECKSKLFYDLYNSILSKNTFSNTTDSVYTMIILPINNLQSLRRLGLKKEDSLERLVDLHENIMKDVDATDTFNNVKYVGHFFDVDDVIKFDVFGKSFLIDSVNVLIGLPVISLVIWLYAGSIFYTISVVLTLIFSAGLTYFVYRLVFRIQFFPFINLLVVATLVGIGGDDTFVLRHIFDLYKKHGLSTLSDNDIGEALSNAALSMFVTSVTTAAALYSLLISDIMIIKCFGVFSGTLILMNYLLAISWLPASLVVLDKYIDPLYRRFCSKEFLIKSFKLYSMFSMATDYVLVSRLLPWMVTRLKYLWLLVFSGLFVGASYVVFYHPGLSLPDNNLLQIFKSENPFEWYSTNIEKYFEFSTVQTPIDIAVVWGLQPVDNSDPLNPLDTGRILLDKSLKITMSTMQAIQYSCELLDAVNVTVLVTHNLCFPSKFILWSENQVCNANVSNGDYPEVCCNYLNEKFKETDLGHCLAESTRTLHLSDYGHPVFDSSAFYGDGRYDVVGLVIYFDTPFNKTQPYTILDDFYHQIDEQFQKTMKESTSDEFMQNAWFVTVNYDIIGSYDLQTSLLKKTPLSLVISVAVTLIFVVLSTKAVLLSFLSMLTILAVIIVTAACLVLLRWQLSIVESTIIIMAVGLGNDISMHYAVGYKLAPSGTRDEKVFATLAFIAVPVALCSLTTLLAGLVMLRVETLAYYETGLFMIIVSIISWLYANFFFLPLLSLCGPQDVGCTSWTLKDIFGKIKTLIGRCFRKSNKSITSMQEINNRTSTPSVLSETCSL